MTAIETLPIVEFLKSARDAMTALNRTVTHAVSLASEDYLLADIPRSQHTRRPPCPWGHRRDAFFWDAWDRSIRGEDDLHRFFEIAERIGGHLTGLKESRVAGSERIPGTALEIVGSTSNLFLPDYWLFVVHHLGIERQLPYEWRDEWACGDDFLHFPYAVISRLPVNVVQASIDALTVLIDVAAPRSWEETLQAGPFESDQQSLRVDPPQPAPVPRNGQRSRKRAERAASIEELTNELREHICAARDSLQAAVDAGREPELLPRPSRRELGERVGLSESAVSRCFSDPAAKELNLLWDTAGDLNAMLKYVRP